MMFRYRFPFFVIVSILLCITLECLLWKKSTLPFHDSLKILAFENLLTLERFLYCCKCFCCFTVYYHLQNKLTASLFFLLLFPSDFSINFTPFTQGCVMVRTLRLENRLTLRCYIYNKMFHCTCQIFSIFRKGTSCWP